MRVAEVGRDASMRYPGGKGASGNVQAIINQIPPHKIYVELFAGLAAVFRAKRPAPASTLVELDSDVCEKLRAAMDDRAVVANESAFDFLERWGGAMSAETFVYVDPPYHPDTWPGGIYRHELTAVDHARLLSMLDRLPCRWALSGYRCAAYDAWAESMRHRRVDFNSMTRGGVRVESLWMNYPEPVALHDYSYVGANFTDRQRIKRKADRWVSMLDAMPPLERGLVLSKINSSFGLDKS